MECLTKEEEKEKILKNEKQKEKVVDDELRKGKSEVNTDKKKDTTPNEEIKYFILWYLPGKRRKDI